MINDSLIAQRTTCITLDYRQDRWDRFQSELPTDFGDFFPLPERYQAIAGKKCPHPPEWKAGGGAWGCYRSHLRILEECLNNEIDSCLFLEDDAVFLPNFGTKLREFINDLPDDWGFIYLGGQHLKVHKNPPIKINNNVYRPFNINRTHAFILRGKAAMEDVYKHLNTRNWQSNHHIDHHLGVLHQKSYNNLNRPYGIYTPREWLVGQAEGKSNVSWKQVPQRQWAPAEFLSNKSTRPFIAVMGLHSSGSSVIAMVLHELGIHMGNDLGGYHGGEAKGLANLCEWAMPFPSQKIVQPIEKVKRRLTHWINTRQREAGERSTIAGGKYPHLCAMGPILKEILGQNLIVVNCVRPLEKSIESLKKRSRKSTGWLAISDQQSEDIQNYLWKQKTAFLEEFGNLFSIDLEGSSGKLESIPTNIYNCSYNRLLRLPKAEVQSLIEFLGISPSKEQIEKAISIIDPSKRTVE